MHLQMSDTAAALHRLDLNLLRVLMEIHDARGVSAACERLHLSQPAVSNALGRLRRALGDELFVRMPRGFVPTAYTTRVMPAVREALARLDDALQRAPPFDPRRSSRWFRIAMTDAGEAVFAPPIAAALAASGGKLRLQLVSLTFESLADVMADGSIDAAVGPLPTDASADLVVTPLFRERYVGLVSRQGLLHRQAGRTRRLPAAVMRRAPLVVVSQGTTLHRRIEELIEREGLAANVVARVPHFVAVPSLVRAYDAIAMVPSEIADLEAGDGLVTGVSLPLSLSPYDVSFASHRRFERDPAVQWLKAQVMRALADRRGGSSRSRSPDRHRAAR